MDSYYVKDILPYNEVESLSLASTHQFYFYSRGHKEKQAYSLLTTALWLFKYLKSCYYVPPKNQLSAYFPQAPFFFFFFQLALIHLVWK